MKSGIENIQTMKQELAREFEKELGVPLGVAQNIAYHDLGNFCKAIETFRMVIKIKPDYIEAWKAMGRTYEYLGDFDKAVKMYEKAVEINPNNAEMCLEIGDMYLHTLFGILKRH